MLLGSQSDLAHCPAAVCGVPGIQRPGRDGSPLEKQ